MKIFKIIKTILKNLGIFVVGGVLGALLSLVLIKPLLAISISKDVGLGIIALAPVIIIFWLILFCIGGGVLGIIIYKIVKIINKKRKK